MIEEGLQRAEYRAGPAAQAQAQAQAPANQQADEDVRRFACDRCRSQKLRCERTRFSIHTPLRDIACRRCIKARVRCCTTSSQSRAGRLQDGPKPSTQHKRQTSKQYRPSAFVPQPDACSTNDEDIHERADVARCEGADHGSYNDRTQHLLQNGVRNSPDRRSQQPDSGAPTTAITAGADRSKLRQTDTLPLYPEMLAPMADTGHEDATMLKLDQTFIHVASSHQHTNGHVQVNMPRPPVSPSVDDALLQDFDSIMEQSFDGMDSLLYFDASPSLDDNNTLTSPSELVGESNLNSHPGAELWPRAGDQGQGKPSLAASISIMHGQTSAPMAIDSSLASHDGDQDHVQLVRRLTQLTTTLLQELDHCSHNNVYIGVSEENDTEAELPGCQCSPISKLLWNAECFVGLLNEATTLIEASSFSTKDSRNDMILSALNRKEYVINKKNTPNRIAGSKQAAAQAATCLSTGGLPCLTTMMAVMATYSCVLQAYEQVFTRIRRSLLVTEVDDKGSKTSPPLLPLFQVDNVKLGGQNNLRVHIAMDVSLQMLKHIESRMSDVLDAFGNSCSSEETKACMLALLQSLTYNGVTDSAGSVSSMICDIINAVRRLFTSEDS